MPKLRVLIVDDSVVIRKILTDALASDGDLEVFTAPNGRIALAKLPQVQPDIVTLDIEMPELDGLGALKELRKTHPRLPVVMFSTLAERGAAMTLDALAAGANDYVTKPANVGSVTIAITRIKDELIPKLKALCGRSPKPTAAATAYRPPVARATIGNGSIDGIVIGVSTGGPNALSALMPLLPADLPVPVAIVQHMPPLFTKLLAERLNAQSKLAVREGAAGELLKAGQVVIAPGGFHMTIARTAEGLKLSTNVEAEENSCRPAVDVLFRSAAKAFNGRLLAVVLTGMGADGQRGCEVVREAGGRVFVQDEATSVVWGMPGAVVRAGVADKILPLSAMAAEIAAAAWQGRMPGLKVAG